MGRMPTFTTQQNPEQRKTTIIKINNRIRDHLCKKDTSTIPIIRDQVITCDMHFDQNIENNIKKVIALSTDKAAAPINLYGATKLCADKLLIAANNIIGKRDLKFSIVRYGNVMGSRGSVIPLFIKQAKEKQELSITDPKMTRFMMSLDNAVVLVLYAFQNGNTGDIFVQKAPSTTIGELAETMKTIYNSNTKIKNIGIRHGEKIHETLLSQEERIVSEDLGDYFRIPADNRDLNYDKYFSKGVKAPKSVEFNSFNTVRLEKHELINLLASIGYK